MQENQELKIKNYELRMVMGDWRNGRSAVFGAEIEGRTMYDVRSTMYDVRCTKDERWKSNNQTIYNYEYDESKQPEWKSEQVRD